MSLTTVRNTPASSSSSTSCINSSLLYVLFLMTSSFALWVGGAHSKITDDETGRCSFLFLLVASVAGFSFQSPVLIVNLLFSEWFTEDFEILSERSSDRWKSSLVLTQELPFSNNKLVIIVADAKFIYLLHSYNDYRCMIIYLTYVYTRRIYMCVLF